MAALLCTRSACLRTINRSFIARPLTAAFTITTSARPHTRQQQTTPPHTSRPTIFSQLPCQRFPGTHRAASTSTPHPPTQPNGENILTWDRFFALRRKRRYINIGCSVVTTLAAVFTLVPIVARQDLDTWGAQISGMDSFVVLIASSLAITAGGWLCGPSFGNLIFGLWARRRGWHAGIQQKEKSFFSRIKRYRANASNSSVQNSMPDYYGEKIKSVQGYRQWLKDQRAFTRKKDKSIF